MVVRRLKTVIKEKAKLGRNLLLGIILIIFSSMALVFQITGSDVEPYTFLFSYAAIEIALVLLGTYMVYDSVRRKQDWRMVNFLFGTVLIFFGIFPILVSNNLLKFLPFTIEFSVHILLLATLLFFSSIYFTVDKFLGIFRKEYS